MADKFDYNDKEIKLGNFDVCGRAFSLEEEISNNKRDNKVWLLSIKSIYSIYPITNNMYLG